MREVATYDTELAHNKWYDGHDVWIAHPEEETSDYLVTDAATFADADGHLFIIEYKETAQ